MDKLTAIQTFLRVAELESFTQAADSLNLPKASVTARVQFLESLLGTKILRRTTRVVQLTTEGSAFVERCKNLLVDFEEAENMFRLDTQIAGKIRVDMIVPLARDFVIPQLGKFLDRYPEIEIEFSSTDHRVDLIKDSIDCVVRSGNYKAKGLIEKELGEMRVVNVASPAYIKKYGIPKKLEDLKNHKLIHFVPTLGSPPEGFEYSDGEKYREVKMTSLITVNTIDSYKAACLAGLGICQNPLIGVAKELKSGRLIELLPRLQAAPMPIKLVYVERKILSPRLRVFLEWLEPILHDYLKQD